MPVWLAALAAVLGPLMAAGSPGPADLREYLVDVPASRIYVVTHKTGLFSFFGHEHAIVPRTWRATLCADDPLTAGAHGTLVIETASLIVDSDSARALAGLGHGPGPSDVATIQRKLLDAAHLSAAAYPEIRIDVLALRATSARVDGRATVALHGVTRRVDFPLELQRADDGALLLSGSLTIRQRDFGITPESIGGVVKVADPVDLHFRLAARPTGRACAANPG